MNDHDNSILSLALCLGLGFEDYLGSRGVFICNLSGDNLACWIFYLDWLKVLLQGLLLSSHHLKFMSESLVSIFV